ncbi:MAG: RNA polymerase sigma factor [Dehalococcoidales bacterium]|nr:RNA polymerase sigma factor [Dehalococcoidales bacterium]
MDIKLEKELIQRAKNNTDAFAELYKEYYDRIFGYVLKRTADIIITQDITSEVFIKALENIKYFHWKGISFSNWLYQIANHEIINGHRKAKQSLILFEELKHVPLELEKSLEAETIEAEEQLKQHQQFLAIHKSIANLPVKYQEVIVLRFFEKKQVKEIGEILGKREGTIRSLIHRGLKKLKEILEEDRIFAASLSTKEESDV